MAELARSFHDLNFLDTLSSMDSPVHRIDARAKLITAGVFILCVVSFPKHEVSALIPYFVFPSVIIPLARIPARFLAGKILFLLPFAVLMGIFNPLYDREVMMSISGIPISGGVLSFTSILVRFVLTVLAALILMAVTGFQGICTALEELKVPRAFSVQLMMLHRYLFVLVSEAVRMARARELRSFGKKGLGIKAYGSLIGYLLLRTLSRAQRIHMSMLSRGFRGDFYPVRPFKIGLPEAAFTAAWCFLFIAFRFVNLPQAAGRIIMGAVS